MEINPDGLSRSAAFATTSPGFRNGKGDFITRSSIDSLGGSFSSFADPSTMEPVVPVAAAPKNDNLYETLVRYHNENDSSSDEEDIRRRRRKREQQHRTGGGYMSASDEELDRDDVVDDRKMPSRDDGSIVDRKLPAKPVAQLKMPPSTATVPSVTPEKASPSAPAASRLSGPSRAEYLSSPLQNDIPTAAVGNPDPLRPQAKKGSFYQAALESQRLQEMPKLKSPQAARKPGIVHVNEPAIRPNSAMYRAAYGGPPARQTAAAPSPFPKPMGVHDVRESLTVLKDSNAASRRKLVEDREDRFDAAKKALGTNRNRSRSPYSRLHHAPTHADQSKLLSQSSHIPRSTMNMPPSKTAPLRQKSVEGSKKLGVGGLNTSAHGLSPSTRLTEPPVNMMNIGSADHMGLAHAANPPKEEKPRNRNALSIFSRQSADRPTRHSSADKISRRKKVPQPTPTSISPDSSGYRKTLGSATPPAPSYPRVAYPSGDPLTGLSTHSAVTSKEYNKKRGKKAELVSPYQNNMSNFGGAMSRDNSPPNTSGYAESIPATATRSKPSSTPMAAVVLPEEQLQLPSQPNTSLHASTESMDEDLRLALELSKQDTGNAVPTNIPPVSSLVETAPSRAKPNNNATSSIPERRRVKPQLPHQSSFGRDAMAMAEINENSSLSDLMLALKLSEQESGVKGRPSNFRSTTNLDELLAFEMSQENNQSMTDFVAAGISTTSTSPTKPDEQRLILERIREEQEQKELELALKASQVETPSFPAELSVVESSDMNLSSDFLISQQKAMDEFSRSSSNQTRELGPRQSSNNSFDSEGRRRELLKRGTTETKQAIKTGNAHVVTCRGCGGRLQAPVSYSLVFCPKCQTISPA